LRVKKVTKQSDNEQKFEKFFFGKMAEDERFEFEKDFAANPELLEELRAFEADLIEKYVRGWMNPAEKKDFETHFLNTEKRRQKVEFSRILIEEVRQNRIKETEKESFWSRFGGWFLTPKIAFASAFSIAVLVFGGWFLLRNFETEKTEIVRNDSNINVENANLKVNSNVANVEVNSISNNTNISNNLTKSPTPTNQKTPEPTKTPTPETPKTAPNPVLALFAGTLRNDGKINELNLPKNSSGATFQLNLKTVDYKIFQAEITDGNGKIIFKSGNLTPRKSALNLFVPAKNLPKGDYRINLYGKNAAGENESAADFQFRVN
jgi:hypothetical protein